jgi:hypothetical protein
MPQTRVKLLFLLLLLDANIYQAAIEKFYRLIR